jgi:AraC-like DNA-binding protein
VSRAITGVLGYPNFNQPINHKRVEDAKRVLADPACNWSVLAIAMDSGFGSIGPFNRAFKIETGMTASEFRMKCQQESKSFQKPGSSSG